jgi:hypothetical protein
MAKTQLKSKPGCSLWAAGLNNATRVLLAADLSQQMT